MSRVVSTFQHIRTGRFNGLDEISQEFVNGADFLELFGIQIVLVGCESYLRVGGAKWSNSTVTSTQFMLVS